jgi:hypothetical protein
MSTLKYMTFMLALGSALCPSVAGQQPPSSPSGQQAQEKWVPFSYRRPYTSVDDMVNKDAEASDPVGIRYYGEDLAHLLLPEKVGDKYIDSFSVRLAKAEDAARSGKRSLIPEAQVAQAYNDLVKKIGLPSSIRATENSIQRFRASAAEGQALPALFTANHNGRNCNPGEATYLLVLLLETNGTLEGLSRGLLPPPPSNTQAVLTTSVTMANADVLLYMNSLRSSRHDTIKLFDHASQILGL